MTMDKIVLEALKGSIQKWENIATGAGEDEGARNCPLCQLFNNEFVEQMCKGCPVHESTGLTGCDGTPYAEWDDSFALTTGRMADTEERKEMAQAEVSFLKSLLPRTMDTTEKGFT